MSGPGSFTFNDLTNADTTVILTNAGIYVLRCTASNGQLQGYSDVTAIVAADVLTGTNILHWTFDDGAGTNVSDTSGHGYNGIFGGMPTWTSNGIIGGALNFTGTNDFVRQATNTSFLNGLPEFTLSLWIKTGSRNVDGGFFAGAVDTYTNQTLSMVARQTASCGTNTDVIEVTVPTTRGVVHRISASDAIRPFEWENIILTWSNTVAPSLYINGQPDQPLAGMVKVAGVLTNCPEFIVGQGWTDGPGPWNGSVDDVRLFRRALSANEALALYGWAVSNHAPVVDAGSNVIVQFDVPVTLTGTVTDDGLPNPPDFVTTTWSDFGTNTVPIPDPTSLSNTFVFTNGGQYTFQLTADDNQAATFSLVTVTSIPPTEVTIYADISDAYEMGPVSGDFTLTRDGDTNVALTVYLAISGTASNGVDYATLTNLVIVRSGVQFRFAVRQSVSSLFHQRQRIGDIDHCLQHFLLDWDRTGDCDHPRFALWRMEHRLFHFGATDGTAIDRPGREFRERRHTEFCRLRLQPRPQSAPFQPAVPRGTWRRTRVTA